MTYRPTAQSIEFSRVTLGEERLNWESYQSNLKEREERQIALRKLESRRDSAKLELSAREQVQLDTMERSILDGTPGTIATLLITIAREPHQIDSVMTVLAAGMRELGVSVTWIIDPIANRSASETGLLIIDDGRNAAVFSTDSRQKPFGEMSVNRKLVSREVGQMLEAIAETAIGNATMRVRMH